MFSGNSELIHVTSEVPGSKIYVDGEYIGTQDGIIKVSKRRTPIIRVTKEGCADGLQAVRKEFDGLTIFPVF